MRSVESLTMKNQSYKQQYEIVLSSKEKPQQLLSALRSILALTFEDPFHFIFLLNRVSWFQQPYIDHLQIFQKTVRLYRAKGKQAAKVGYNILVEGLTIRSAYTEIVESISRLMQGTVDMPILLQSLKENYPYKLSPLIIHQTYVDSLLLLTKKFPHYRQQLLEIIIENLVLMDTEILQGDQWINQPFPSDNQLRHQRQNHEKSDIQMKYDRLLCKLMGYMNQVKNSQFSMDFLTDLFVAFRKKILLANKIKSIQLIIFAFGQHDKIAALKLASLFLGIVLSQYHHLAIQNFKHSIYYLTSYLIRSNLISLKKLMQITEQLMNQLLEQVSKIKQQSFEATNLHGFKCKHAKQLQLLQSILLIICYNPILKEKFSQQLSKLLCLCENKIFYTLFIRSQILNALDIKFTIQCEPIKFQQKFNPTTLPLFGQMTDSLIKINDKLCSKRFNEYSAGNKPYKKVKKEHEGTPISVGTFQQSTDKY